MSYTKEDYQKREKFLIKYIESQIFKFEKIEETHFSPESRGKRSAYKDILFKLNKDK
jgi:hypothetical protein